MTTFEVWAPRPHEVLLETADGERHAMARDDAGWWHVELDYAGRYWYVLDGERRPDPRAPRLPDGVDGPAHTVAPSDFTWTDQAWRGRPFEASLLYELHIGTFSADGTFVGAEAHLDHLVELGVDAVEVMPIASFPGVHGWGYDGVGLFAPHEPYGGPSGFQRFVDACHARGLAVVLDVVLNHLGPLGNHLAAFGPYFTDRTRTPWGEAINLDDAGADEVRRFLIDCVLQWLRDYHVDGVRLDAVHALHDESATHLLEELGARVAVLEAQLGRTLWVIAESDLNDPRLVRSREAHGYGLDAAWSDDLHHALHVCLTGERDGYYVDFEGLADLAAALRDVYVRPGGFRASRQRSHGRAIGDLPRSRFVGFAQNHDQIGNRAIGERLCHLTSLRRAQVAAALVLCAPSTPMLFMGEEWAASTPFQYFTDHPDPQLADAVREGRRTEFASFGWDPSQVPDPQDLATFARSRLAWDELDHDPHDAMLRWYRALVELRRAEPALRSSTADATAVDYDDAAGWLLLRRGPIAVAVNVGPVRQTVPLGVVNVEGAVTVESVLLSNDAVIDLGASGITLDPDGIVIARVAPSLPC